MNRKIPVKSLAQVNLLMTIVSGGFLSILIFIYGGLTPETLYIVINAVISLIVISFLHIRVAVKLYIYRRHLSFKKRRLYLYIITYVAALAYSFLTIPVRNFLADGNWQEMTFHKRVVSQYYYRHWLKYAHHHHTQSGQQLPGTNRSRSRK